MEATVRHIIPQPKKNNNVAFLIAVVLISVLIFVRCTGGAAKALPPKSDTIKTVCLYQKPLNGELEWGYVIRITLDTVKLVEGKAIKTRDSLYFTPYVFPMKKDGKEVLDSLGKPKMELAWQPHPKKLIIKDFNANFPY